MQAQPSDRLVIRDYPAALWAAGAAFLVAGVALAIQPKGLVPGIVTGVVGALIAFLPTVLTVSADRQRGVVTVRHRSLFQASAKEYPFRDIASVEVDGSVSIENRRRRASYRLLLVLASGDRVPLRSYYSGGYNRKARTASQLSQYLGLPDAGSRPVFPIASQAGTAAAPGADYGAGQEGTTDGVTWQAGTNRAGGMAVRRWMSPDYRLPGQFVCLLQKPKGSASFGGGGIGGKMGQMVFQQMLSMYGFSPADLPGLSSSGPIQGLASGVAEHFSSLTNDQASARQVLNPWVTPPLQAWAEQYPLKAVQSAGTAGQLVVLFSPQGVYLTCMQSGNPAQAEALGQLGVNLVRAQGTSPAAA
jgi:hypothetical protein